MRSVITISMQPREAKALKKRASDFGFASLSEYFRFLVNLDEGLISQKEILNAAHEAEKDYKAKKLTKAGSLMDLI